MPAVEDAKKAAIEQWTADPCGADRVDGEPGTRGYIEDLLAMRRDYAPWLAEELDYAGARGLDVLDVGCGQGIDVVQYASAGARAHGVDLTPRHVELATRHADVLGLEARIVLGDAEALPHADESFDRVSSNGVLHHTPRIDLALNEIRRVLRPEGQAMVIVYNRNSLHYWGHQVLVEGILRGHLLRERGMAGVLSRGVEHSRAAGRPLVNVYSRRAMEALMRDAGFVGVATSARHFHPSDTVFTRVAARHLRGLRDPRVLDRIGAAVGWYVIARGSRPA